MAPSNFPARFVVSSLKWILSSAPGATSRGIRVTTKGVVMLTFWITSDAEPAFLTTKSCSTTTPDLTSPNTKRTSGKTAFGPSQGATSDARPMPAGQKSRAPGGTVCCEKQKGIREDAAKNTSPPFGREITNAPQVSVRRGRVVSRPHRPVQAPGD